MSPELLLWTLLLFVCGWYGTSRLLGQDAQFFTQIIEKSDTLSTKLTGDAIALVFGVASLYGMFFS